MHSSTDMYKRIEKTRHLLILYYPASFFFNLFFFFQDPYACFFSIIFTCTHYYTLVLFISHSLTFVLIFFFYLVTLEEIHVLTKIQYINSPFPFYLFIFISFFRSSTIFFNAFLFTFFLNVNIIVTTVHIQCLFI